MYNRLIINIIEKNNNKILEIINNITSSSNIDLKTFIINFSDFIINNYNNYITNKLLTMLEFIIHLDEKYYYNNLLNFFVISIQEFIY